MKDRARDQPFLARASLSSAQPEPNLRGTSRSMGTPCASSVAVRILLRPAGLGVPSVVDGTRAETRATAVTAIRHVRQTEEVL